MESKMGSLTGSLTESELMNIIKTKNSKYQWAQLGKGNMGSIYKFTVNGGMYYTAKTALSNDKKLEMSLRNENVILKALQGVCRPYLQCFRSAITVDNEFWLVSDFIEGVEGYTAIMEQDVPLSKKIITSFLNGLKILHEHGIAHLDIKPENFIYNPKTETITFIDMGLSCMGNQESPCTYGKGTPYYFCPEIFQIKTIEDAKKADMWSLGMTLLVWHTKLTPYSDDDMKDILFDRKKPIDVKSKEWINYVNEYIQCKYTQALLTQFQNEHDFDLRRLLNTNATYRSITDEMKCPVQTKEPLKRMPSVDLK